MELHSIIHPALHNTPSGLDPQLVAQLLFQSDLPPRSDN
jgi:hypothetical protein